MWWWCMTSKFWAHGVCIEETLEAVESFVSGLECCLLAKQRVYFMLAFQLCLLAQTLYFFCERLAMCDGSWTAWTLTLMEACRDFKLKCLNLGAVPCPCIIYWCYHWCALIVFTSHGDMCLTILPCFSRWWWSNTHYYSSKGLRIYFVC